jgi:16S rRNA (adenine1518-N6/adenine1519-N6)-dimethyltransferase
MNPTEINAILKSLGAQPNKKLGQHFLIDDAALNAVVEAASIRRGDRVLEVGPGLGVLTRELLDRGAEVTAIERDRSFVSYLEKTYAGQPVKVVYGDASDIHWHELIGEGAWKFVSNLPYAISSLALRKALWAPRPASRVVVLVQREVGERAIAKDGKTSLLSLMVALASTSSRIVRRVPAGAFYPPPKVESVVLEIKPMSWEEREKKWGVNPEEIMSVAKTGFAHPRKQLPSNLGVRWDKALVLSVLRHLSIDEKIRAEDLSPEQWAKLTIALK